MIQSGPTQLRSYLQGAGASARAPTPARSASCAPARRSTRRGMKSRTRLSVSRAYACATVAVIWSLGTCENLRTRRSRTSSIDAASWLKPAEAAEAKAAKPKLRWTLDGERDEKGRVAQTGTPGDGTAYKITGSGDEWVATVASGKGRKPELLAAKVSHTSAYLACTKHNAA